MFSYDKCMIDMDFFMLLSQQTDIKTTPKHLATEE